jgi:hypothetical protein
MSLPLISVKKLVNQYLSNKEYNCSTTLCAIMTSFGSDKGDERHNYTTLYSKLFNLWKDERISLFELGIGTNFSDIPSNMGLEGKPGASLYGWSLFFPQGMIYGADIDKRILFQDHQIKTYYCDQCDSQSIQSMFLNNDLKDIVFDIIIEDGLHEFEPQLNFLKNSIHKLKKRGIYITEDLTASSRTDFIKLVPELKKNLDLSYIEVINIPSKLNRFDNSLLVIQR